MEVKNSVSCFKLMRRIAVTSRWCKLRFASSYVSKEISLKKLGDPAEALEIVERELSTSSLKPTEVVVKILATPVHPADLNRISGTYGSAPDLPAVLGMEGVVRILEVGPEVTTIKPGDRAVLAFRKWGTWRTHHICPERELLKVPDYVSTLTAATINTNPGTALLMLENYVKLNEGDTVIQNTANSAVGQAVIQICKDKKLKSINVVRNRPNIEQLKDYLTNLGADCVITEEELRLPKTKELLSKFAPSPLALNGAGGKILSDMLKYIADGGTVVTYGGMTRQPVTIPTRALIFNNLKFHGFWLNKWIESRVDENEIRNLINDLYGIVKRNNLKPPNCALVPLEDFQKAVPLAMEPFSGKKQILVTENIE